MTNRYKLIPNLPPDQYEALKRDLDENGVRTSGVSDQDGNLLEGFQRDRICRELKINFPIVVRTFTSEAEKLAFVLAANCQRRQLSRKQKAELIATYLLRDPEIADNNLAGLIGCSHNTVKKVRRDLERTRQIDKLKKFRGKDGRRRRPKQILANSPKQREKASEVIHDLPESCDGKIIDFTTAQRQARRNKEKQKWSAETEIATPLPTDAIQLHHCRFQELEKEAGIEPGTVQLINTDIPYGKEFLSQLPDLAEFAERVLIENGLLVLMTGQYWLDKAMAVLNEHLTYRWVIANYWDCRANPVYLGGGKVTSKWKPILIYSKGNRRLPRPFLDVLCQNKREKEFHGWQQPLSEVETLINYFSNPGDLVVDPCSGSFTTALACRNLGRRCISCDSEQASVEIGQQRLAGSSQETILPLNRAIGLAPLVCPRSGAPVAD